MGRESRTKEIRRQARSLELVQPQLHLPLVDAVVGIKTDLLGVIHVAGMKVLEAMLEEDRLQLCGPKYARRPDRECVRGGTVGGEVVLGGRRVAIRRPRVHSVGGGEVPLPTYEEFRQTAPLDRRAVEQMLVGVATRKYTRSLEALPAGTPTRGTSRSAVSRRFVARTQAELDVWRARPLGDLHLVALVLDGIGFGDYALVVALGIDASGQKHPLAVREGTTENATVCRALLADLVERGVPADRAILVMIDGGKGLRKAVKDVFGQYALVQRCQVHKKRNVVGHLPEGLRPHVRLVLSAAYAMTDADKAQKRLEQLAASLDEKHPDAAGSLREGLEETLAVLKLGVSPTLRRSLATTNGIENMFSTVRRISDRVTRWPTGTMALRWALAGMGEAARTFRRLMGMRDMPRLVAALHEHDLKLAVTHGVRAVA